MKGIHDKHNTFNLADIQLSTLNIATIENAYVTEKEMMLAVQSGNVNKLADLYENSHNHYSQDHLNHLLKRIPQDPIRQLKNMMFVKNTLLRTAAMKGGLPVLYLHTISEKFAISIENSISFDFLFTLSKKMETDYANAVATFSTLNYSNIVKEAICYITSNIARKICIVELGSQLGVNPSYLSRTFKENTGMSISNYINHQRIELSKFYFESGSDNVTEIAFQVGYNDSNYFSKIFKKTIGITPKEFIKNLKIKN
ncbi:helix-turn-helix transcriptional regulator [Lacrimispora sp. 38-1]|uniref:helix-turn-helix transcriptional regulator n=1 Tax=Lacrimispora sp. 38-1 TaxID=3125778 RepID=UPI003CEBD78E